MVEVWRQLLRDHVPNPHGRCRACTQGVSSFLTNHTSSGPSRLSDPALSRAAIGAERWARIAAERLPAYGVTSRETPE